jgi:NitT/TauT family transport system substrate-binding protein
MEGKKTRMLPKIRNLLSLVGVPLLITIITVTGMGSWSCQKQQYSGPVEKLTLGTLSSEISALVWVAESQGYFAQNGLEVTIDQYEAGTYAVNDLLAGINDIACAADYVFTVNSFVKNNIRVLAQIATADIHEIVVKKDHGIEKPSDLKGKKIGLTKRTTAEFFLGRFLLFNNLKLSDIETIDLTPSQLFESLLNNEIDAASLFEPNVYNLKQRLGTNAISWPSQLGRDFYWLLITREDVLKARPAAIERFLRSIVQAEEFANQNPAKAMQIVAQRLKYEDAYIQYSWPKSTFMVSIDQGLLLSMEDQARWLISNKLTDKTQIPNYLNFIHQDALETVNPKSVTVIQ